MQPVKCPVHLALCGTQCLLTFSWVCFLAIGYFRVGWSMGQETGLVLQACNSSEVKLSQEYGKFSETLSSEDTKGAEVVVPL